MAGPREQSKPTFLWQAILILLPVLVLTAIGWISLRRDKLLARQEAASQAQALADDLVPRLWSEIISKGAGDSNQISFQVDAEGKLISPPACPALPVPKPYDANQLSADQLRLWRLVQNADGRNACDD